MLTDFRILRAQRLVTRALVAWEEGASTDQLSDFLLEIQGVLALDPDEGGGEDERDEEARSDAAASPLMDRET